jgi:hypothetical protein
MSLASDQQLDIAVAKFPLQQVMDGAEDNGCWFAEPSASLPGIDPVKSRSKK